MIPLALTALLAAAPPTSDAPLVLAVGVNDPGAAGLPALHFADDDAVAALDVFGAVPNAGRGVLLGTLDDESQRARPEHASLARPATLRALRAAVREIASRVQAASDADAHPSVVVWLSGHAETGPDGRTRFLLADGDGLDENAIREEILLPLAGAHRVLLFIDSCFAAGLVQPRARVDGVTVEQAAHAFARIDSDPLPNVGIWLASSAGTRAWEWEELGAGVFSAMVRAGLRGAADADGDDVVRTSELEAWLAAASQAVRIDDVRPRVKVIAPAIERDAVVMRREWSTPTRVLRADLSALGPLHVIDDVGTWLLGGTFEPGFVVSLWLPMRAQLWMITRGGERKLEDSASGWSIGDAQARGAHARGLMGAAAMDEALRDGLFQTPYGPSFVRGYAAAAAPDSDASHGAAAHEPNALLLVASGATISCAAVGAVLAGTAFVAFASTDKERAARDSFAWGIALTAASAAALAGGVALAVTGSGAPAR
jgi:hypothetical protein